MRAIVKGDDPRSSINLHKIGVEWMIVRMKKQCRVRAAPFMRVPEPIQIHIYHRVAVHHDEPVSELIEPGQYRAGRAEWFFFVDVSDAHAPFRAIPKIFFDEICAVMNKKKQIRKVVASCQFDLMLQQWFVSDEDHRLGQIAEAFFESRTLSAGEYDSLFHFLKHCGGISQMAEKKRRTGPAPTM
jgi:hypothetical protein